MSDPETRPSRTTRAAERHDAATPAGADRAPTPEEEEAAADRSVDDDVADHYKEMAESGAKQRGEGRVP